ncbi:MAG: hypothetical protein JSR36_12860 [Proteobacteria bacterium]|nr:hypothetical protein [Pseudomonadota bacterium]
MSGQGPGILVLGFILVMAWLRTRLQYPRAPGSALRLTRAGLRYFLALLGLLVLGCAAAPALARQLGLASRLPVTVAQAAWFLGTYLLFIPVHRVLRARGIGVFRVEGPAGRGRS